MGIQAHAQRVAEFSFTGAAFAKAAEKFALIAVGDDTVGDTVQYQDAVIGGHGHIAGMAQTEFDTAFDDSDGFRQQQVTAGGGADLLGEEQQAGQYERERRVRSDG